ncbi:hypothetical protein NIG5292_00830 [Nereida ignava]|uniref:Uncharacterized protein n=1 Tax=Nereida ignava TaxID=282199 RepID=A0A0U1NJY5_9RHOB|nr:hypothetical protein NIG5292_00830 [Nereida ignava]SFJ61590.1 hypothetical protein SAMN02745667_01785 [Nereida ignava DSM 16309]
MTLRPHNPFMTIYFQIAQDYFHRMGGAGRYEGFQEWHPALLTLACALEAVENPNLGAVWSRLPNAIVQKCDGLRSKIIQSFRRDLEPFEHKLDCVRTGADLLVQELSTNHRGKPLSHTDIELLERVKLEFNLALSGKSESHDFVNRGK